MKWEVQIPKWFKEHRNIVTSEGVKVATVWEDGANTESTAHLIAAAPDMLAAPICWQFWNLARIYLFEEAPKKEGEQ